MKINILYEDEYVLALDKPAGIMVHADGRNKEPTLVDWVIKNRPGLGDVGEVQTLQNGEIIKRPGIVHRLDKETSGVILIAKTKEAHRFLKEQFQKRKVEKVYHAVVWGNFSLDKMRGTINKPIGRSSRDFRKWSAEYGAKGEIREAVTEYKVLAQKKFEKSGHTHHSRSYKMCVEDGFAYLEVKPKTGRTHQIRVHLKSIGHPVVGDKLYGGRNHELRSMNDGQKFKDEEKKQNLGFDRLALHALSIKLELPNGIYIQTESPLPPEFESAKNLLKKA